MNCPKCNKPAISFIKWASGMSAFKTKCANCGAELKANSITMIGFILTIIVVATLVIWSRSYLDPELSKSYIRYILALPIAVLLAFVVFKTGGYKESK